jgi:dihydroxyacid dehydratase/phosphogluconate dehydratase
MHGPFSSGLLNSDCLTVTGRTVAENYEHFEPVRGCTRVATTTNAQDVIFPVAQPYAVSYRLLVL